jgi:phosphatidylinositol alpha 1,6-mannosyltransferase
VDTDHFRPLSRDDQLRAQLAPRGEMLVGFVGRLAPEKKVLRLAALQGIAGIQRHRRGTARVGASGTADHRR